MQDSQNLERVVLTFDKFDIPMLGKQKNKYFDIFENQLSFLTFTFNRCKDGYVKVYIQGQEEEHKYDKHDFMFCGKFHFPSLDKKLEIEIFLSRMILFVLILFLISLIIGTFLK